MSNKTGFHDKMKMQKLSTFSTQSRVKDKRSSREGGIVSDRRLFARMLVISRSSNVDIHCRKYVLLPQARLVPIGKCRWSVNYEEQLWGPVVSCGLCSTVIVPRNFANVELAPSGWTLNANHIAWERPSPVFGEWNWIEWIGIGMNWNKNCITMS